MWSFELAPLRHGLEPFAEASVLQETSLGRHDLFFETPIVHTIAGSAVEVIECVLPVAQSSSGCLSITAASFALDFRIDQSRLLIERCLRLARRFDF